MFTWGQVRVELEGGRVHCDTGKATEEEATLLTPPMWWGDLALPPCTGLKNCVVLWGTHSVCVPCRGPRCICLFPSACVSWTVALKL